MTDRRLITLRQLRRYLPTQRKAVGLHARTREENNLIAVPHVTGDAQVFRENFSDRGTGQHNGFGLHNPTERRRLAPAPHRPSLAAAFGETRHQRIRARLVRKPARIADRRVHGHRDGQRPAGHQIVHHRRDSIDGDFAIEARARRRIHRIRHEVLRAEPFLDVREKMIRRLNQIGALTPRRRGFAITVAREHSRRGARGLLARALKRIELIVTDPG